MKKIQIAVLVALLLASCKKNESEALADIRKECAKIASSLGDYSKKVVEDIVSPGKGTITGYYDGDDIKKVYAEHYTDSCRIFLSFYFHSDRLIFIDEQDFIYNKSMKYTEAVARQNNDSVWYDDKKTRLVNSRFYFFDNKMIKWLTGDIDVPVNAPGFKTEEAIQWAESALMIKELKEQ